MKTLKLGDTVNWSGAWGTQAPVPQKVIRIEKDCVGKEGTQCSEINWDDCNNDSVIVDLDNGKWAYGFQLKPIE
jgi:hypothetical protein